MPLPACFLAFLLFAVLLQWRSGAFSAEFSGWDESAHYVTSLMVHDYVTSGMQSPPRQFAEKYYLHYPRVMFGAWPPLFHFSQAAWMLAFSPARISVLIMMGCWAALLATGCFYVVRAQFGFVAAFCLGLVLVSLPEVQAAANTVMADLMMSCFMFTATLFFARYLKTARTFDAFLFGLISSAAILVKYNALALALVPLFALVLTRRFGLMLRWSFWLPAATVVVICGPWYLWDRALVKFAMEPVPGLADVPRATWANLLSVIELAGIPLFVLSAVGVFSRRRRSGYNSTGKGIGAAGLSLVGALWFFHSFLYPINDSRYFLAALPVLLLFAAAGCAQISSWLAAHTAVRESGVSAVLLSACVIYSVVTFEFRDKKSFGISDVAASILRDSGNPQEIVLVSGSPQLEGMLISEMALRDRTQRHCVLRASKLLGRTGNGAGSQLVYQAPEEITRFLNEVPVSKVIFDRSREYNVPKHPTLRQALVSAPSVWVPVDMGSSSRIEVYQRTGPLPITRPSLYLDLKQTLGMALEVPLPQRRLSAN